MPSLHPSRTKISNDQIALIDLPNNGGNGTTSRPQPPDNKEQEKHNQQSVPYSIILLFTDRSQSLILLIAVTSALLKGVFGPAVALLVGKIFGLLNQYATGTISTDALLSTASSYSMYLTAIGAASFFVNGIFFASWAAFGERQAKVARDQLFTALLKQRISWFDLRKEGPSALIPRLNAQIKDLQLATSQPLGAIVSILANAIFAFGLAMYYSWKLTLVIIASLPVLLAFVILTNWPMGTRAYHQEQAKTDALRTVSTALSAIDTVKCNNAQAQELLEYAQKISKVSTWYNKVVHVNALQQSFAAVLAGVLFVQAFYYGGVLFRKGERSPGDVVTTFLSALSIFTSLNSINQQMLRIEVGRVAGGRMKAILAEVRNLPQRTNRLQISAPAAAITPEHLRNGHIEFDKIYFTYPTRPEYSALKKFSIRIPLGQLSFIVGPSGSGKSTLGQLLTRLYDPLFGTIKIAGFDIKDLLEQQLREMITLVEQHSVLFNDTIRKNIELGQTRSDGANTIDVRAAIEFATLQLAIVDMPENDKTLVGLCGERLSGGQRQRVALARAYVRNSPILILDESTSALDHIHRNLIMDAIRYWRQGKTTIMITHDTELIRPDDYVYVIASGKLQHEGWKCDIYEHVDAYGPKSPRTTSSPTIPGSSPMSTTSSPPLLLSGQSASTIPSATHGPYLARKQPLPVDDTIDIYLNDDYGRKSSAVSRHWSSYMIAPSQRYSVAFTSQPWLYDQRPDRTTSLVRRYPTDIAAGTPDLSLQLTNSRNLELAQQLSRAERRASVVSEGSERSSVIIDRAGWQASRAREEFSEARLRRRHSIRSYQAQVLRGQSQDIRKQELIGLAAILKTIWPVINYRQRTVLVFALLLCGVQAACMPVTSLLATRLIATYSFAPGSQRQALTYAMSMVAVAAANGLSHYALQRLFEYVAQEWINRLRGRALERLLDQSKEFFTKERNSIPVIVEELDRHADDTRNVLGRFVSLYMLATMQITISVFWSLATAWNLTLVTLAFLPIIVGLTRSLSAVSKKWETRCNDAAARINNITVETFTSIKTVKLMTAERHRTSKAMTSHQDAYKIGIRKGLLTGLFYGLAEASQTLAEGAIFYYAAKLAADNTTISKVVQVLFMLLTTFAQVTMILAVIPQASLARDAATRFFRLANLPGDSHEHSGTSRATSIAPVSFKNVTFRYPTSDRAALSDATFDIPANSLTCIVGASGSGKSTVTALLLRLWPLSPGGGSITTGGRSLASLHTPSLRDRIALVQQSNPVLPASIAANIGYGLRAPVDPARITAAAEAAGLAPFIASLPHGYDTVVGEGGQGLSGGQQQRLAIARALARDPDMLVLDEATSALDAGGALLLREELRRLVSRPPPGRRPVTVVCVTHDRRLMEVADWLVVLEAGTVAEQGTFDQLVRQNGALARLLKGG